MPGFFGKNSSLRKAKRLQRELKGAVPCSVGKLGLQVDIVPLMLNEILLLLRRGRIDLVIDYLDDMQITNEMVIDEYGENMAQRIDGSRAQRISCSRP